MALTTNLAIGSECIVNLGQRFVCEWIPLIAQLVKNLPAMLESSVRFLSQRHPLEKG